MATVVLKLYCCDAELRSDADLTLNHTFYRSIEWNSSSAMNWQPRIARVHDLPVLEELIRVSSRVLQAPYYSATQIEAALGPIFAVDRQLLRDGTYFVIESGGTIVGCGGWSKRKSLYGGDSSRATEDAMLDPRVDAARIRAFFVHPSWARRGIGKSILNACEDAIVSARFLKANLVATLAGEPLYAAFGYDVVERCEIPMSNGLSLPVVRMSKYFGAA
jgi:N-acetylglutamate synthase-like GNAT family acetyltransferase